MQKLCCLLETLSCPIIILAALAIVRRWVLRLFRNVVIGKCLVLCGIFCFVLFAVLLRLFLCVFRWRLPPMHPCACICCGCRCLSTCRVCYMYTVKPIIIPHWEKAELIQKKMFITTNCHSYYQQQFNPVFILLALFEFTKPQQLGDGIMRWPITKTCGVKFQRLHNHHNHHRHHHKSVCLSNGLHRI